MKAHFELAGGSITGREHLRTGKNNQDAYYWLALEDVAIATICDGCGSGPHSEVGAKLGARMTVDTVQRFLSKQEFCIDQPEFWQLVYRDLLHQCQTIADQLGGHFVQTVQDYLLFTIVGTVVTPTLTTVFALGDGVVIVNGDVLQIGPFANNAPPYLAYGLVQSALSDSVVNPLQFQILQTLPTQEIDSMLIGSDGVSDLIAVSDKPLPGQTESVGAIAQFWQQHRYFQNPDQVRRRLALMNREVTKPDWQTQRCIRQSGLLPDDTTLIVLRRYPSS
ncbi:MAG TPA: protein phosphatase 2C domain-containing protein [Crinalium sp.]|jgi:serine/threonine protein phosphatase PrpC